MERFWRYMHSLRCNLPQCDGHMDRIFAKTISRPACHTCWHAVKKNWRHYKYRRKTDRHPRWRTIYTRQQTTCRAVSAGDLCLGLRQSALATRPPAASSNVSALTLSTKWQQMDGFCLCTFIWTSAWFSFTRYNMTPQQRRYFCNFVFDLHFSFCGKLKYTNLNVNIVNINEVYFF